MNALAALTGALVAASWQVALIAAGFALVRLLLPKAEHRYVAALLALALQVAWPVATFVDLQGHASAQINPGLVAHSPAWLVVPLAWSLGATVMLARMLGGLALVRRWVRRAGALEASLEARFERLRARLGVRAVQFGVVDHLDTPLTVGFWRPVVLLPVSVLTALPLDALELLVAHELVHVRRWDALINAVQMVIEAVLFFHPAMWWVSKCARDEREYACDDAVVQSLGAPRRYAEALLALEQSRQPATDLAVASTGGAFVNRIRRLIGGRTTRSPWPLVFALVVLAGGTTALALTLRAPKVPLIAVSEQLKPTLAGLCRHVHDDPCRPEVLAGGGLPTEDAMTIVLADLGERVPEFEQFMGAIGQVPVAQRHEALVASLSAATGSEWSCPEFEALWNGQPVTWCGR